MHRKISEMRRIAVILLIIQAALLVALWFWINLGAMIGGVVLIIEAIIIFVMLDRFESLSDEQSTGVRDILGSAAADAYIIGGVGMVIYDDDYVVTWMSDLFRLRNIDKVGNRLLTWLPEAEDLINGTSDRVEVTLDDHIYEITRKEDAPVIYFRDVTELTKTTEKYKDEHLVLGLASFDNYDESTQYEDDTEAASISANVRSPLMEYCADHGILAKRLGTSRYQLILNEKIFAQLAADHFSILGKVRKASQKMDVSITLSLAFARGDVTLEEMDEMVSNLMDLAQTRGGDQVAVQEAGGDVQYFGGSTEAAEKRSRVRVRVMSHALRDLIMKSSNVIICCHKMADFDCVGSAICLSRMASALGRKVQIIAKTGGIEEKLNAAMEENSEALSKEVTFVTEGEALNKLTDNTLVIMTDHHNVKQSNGARVLEQAGKVVVIDHHRRSADMGVKPILVYIEAGASSTCELLTEMIPYVSNRTDISELDATFMLTGMIVDTQTFRVRTGARTYDAASSLKEMGADSGKAFGWLKDSFDEFALKAAVATGSEKYDHGVVIASVTRRQMSRSLMSQVADELLGVQGVQAAFVIADDNDDQTCISARSAGKINVQVIMENMGGGGHMTAAAMQRKKCDVEDVKNELLAKLHTYFAQQEEDSDESNS